MRPRPFFIFALPRSGTAWLSVFLSGRDSFCFHEPTADRPPHALGQIFAQRPEHAVGAIDTGAHHFSRESFKDFRCFVLQRDLEEVKRSIAALREHCVAGLRVSYDAAEDIKRLERATRGLPVIEYASLGSLAALEEIWRQVIGMPFDAERARQLLEMQIERDVERFFKARPQLCVSRG